MSILKAPPPFYASLWRDLSAQEASRRPYFDQGVFTQLQRIVLDDLEIEQAEQMAPLRQQILEVQRQGEALGVPRDLEERRQWEVAQRANLSGELLAWQESQALMVRRHNQMITRHGMERMAVLIQRLGGDWSLHLEGLPAELHWPALSLHGWRAVVEERAGSLLSLAESDLGALALALNEARRRAALGLTDDEKKASAPS
jgi:hypothetical protein